MALVSCSKMTGTQELGAPEVQDPAAAAAAAIAAAAAATARTLQL